MKTTRLLILSLLPIAGIVHAQAPATPDKTPAPATETVQTEMQKWIATTDAQWQAAFNRDVVDMHAAALKKLAGQYDVSLETALTKASAAGDLDGALALRNEQKRFAETNVFPQQDLDGEAASVKQIRAATRLQLARIEQENAARTKALHAKYDAVLAQAQQQLTQAKRLDDALLVKGKRDEVAAAWLPQATGVPGPAAVSPLGTATGAPTVAAGPKAFLSGSYLARIAKALTSPKKTTPIGNRKNGNEFIDLPGEPAILVGLAVRKGDWFGTPIISALEPIYETRSGRIRGKEVGKKGGKLSLVAEARPGYVVTEVVVCAPQNHIHGIKLVFRKLDVFHQGVVANDTYESEWLGIEYNSKSARVGDPARPAIGLWGRADEWVGALGLLQAP